MYLKILKYFDLWNSNTLKSCYKDNHFNLFKLTKL